jgi:zona occludens toxin (predicted ATPase)
MPILITGGVGSGKTCGVVSRLKKDRRPVFYMNIRSVRLDNWMEVTPEDMPDWRYFGLGSEFDGVDFDVWDFKSLSVEQKALLRKIPPRVLVIDEAHNVFPQEQYKTGATEVWQKQLTEYRHYGYTIFLVTQKPNLVWSFVRTLCYEHHHYYTKLGFIRLKRVFKEYVSDPERASGGTLSFAFLDRGAFKLYSSYLVSGGAERSTTWLTYVAKFGLPLLLLSVVFVGYRLFLGISGISVNKGGGSELSPVVSLQSSPAASFSIVVPSFSFLSFEPDHYYSASSDVTYYPFSSSDSRSYLFGSELEDGYSVVFFMDASEVRVQAMDVADLIRHFGYVCQNINSGINCHGSGEPSFFAPYHASLRHEHGGNKEPLRVFPASSGH